ELVYMTDTEHRLVNPARARAGDIVSFADGYPFLLISEASLEDLNARLDEPITMDRFRPNIVVSGTEPYAEDGYSQVRLGELWFRGVKRCDRCVVTTIDPLTGERGSEPLRTLAKYRLEDQRVWFGMNLIHDGTGMLRVGDPVTRLATT
ncbi:MAG TPA: MOSC domain-containing protein, partial [Polyangiaceae bacterium]